ncbi:MAG TPA: hypothetical protein VMN36_02410 [Verrucomicrobiales bacterium]|nr:hypothetical protein [Verrucomicrobiales bacterium]
MTTLRILFSRRLAQSFRRSGVFLALPIVLCGCGDAPEGPETTVPPAGNQPSLLGSGPASQDAGSSRRVDAEAAGRELDRFSLSLPEAEAHAAMAEYLMELAAGQPELAAFFLSRISRVNERRRLLEAITGAWAQSAPEDLYHWAQENLAGAERLKASEGAILALAESEAWDRAAEFLDGLPFSTERTGITERLAQLWAWSDPASAFSWAFQIEDQSNRGRALVAMADQLAVKRPDLAAQVLHSEGQAGRVKTDITRALARAQAGGNIDLNLVSSLSEALQQAYHTEVVATLRKTGVHQALDYAAGLEDVASRTEGVRLVLDEIFQRNPAEAAAQFSAFEDAEAVQPALADWFVDRWYALDSEAASMWIGELPPGEVRDRAVLSLVQNVSQTDLDAAAAWAGAIEDQDLQKAAAEWLSQFQPRQP